MTKVKIFEPVEINCELITDSYTPPSCGRCGETQRDCECREGFLWD